MLENVLVQEAMNLRAAQGRPSGAQSSAPGPQVGWIQFKEKGPLHRLYLQNGIRYYYWSVACCRFIPISKDRLPEILQL